MDPGVDAYRSLFDTNPLPMFVSDRETLQILEVNQAACEHYGWSRDELLGMTIRDIRPPEEVVFFEQSFNDPSKDPLSRYSRSARHRRKDGRIIEVTLQIAGTTFKGRPASVAVVTDVTGIAEAERRFRLLVENSVDGISLTSAQNVIEYVSPGGLRILGYRDRAMAGTDATTITHPDDIPTWTPPLPGETNYHVARIRHQDGSWRWIESATRNLTHDPAVRAYVSNYRDVTERKNAEQALLESQQRLEFLLSATSAVLYTARLSDYGATFIGANVQQVLGHDPAAFYADPAFWLDNIHPDDRALLHVELEDKLHDVSCTALTLQYRFRHADGGYRWMRDVCRILRDADGKPLEVVGYWIDASDHVRAEESTRRSEANFRALIERAPVATLVHREGRFVYLNPAAVAMLGYDTAEELVGRVVLDLIHLDDREGVRARMNQLPRSGSVPRGTARMIRRDGTLFVIEAEAHMLDFDGQPSHVVMGIDVTEREEIFTRMALADRMLSVGTLAAGVAHEINNPLAYLVTNLEILAGELANIQPSQRSKLTETTLHTLVSDARDGAARVSAIVRDLRALSRPDDEPHGPVDIGAVIGSSLKMVHNEVRHRAHITQSFAPGLPQIEGEASRLGQVFINLLLNAAQAIPEGHVDGNEITLRAYPTSDGTQVRIEIADTGCGIPAPILRRIFDPFFTTKAPGAGTGLGLSISHQIVTSMAGQITVESTPGQGSTFTVTLPVAASQRAAAAGEPAPPAVASSRILLIDDEPAVGRSLTMLLAPETEVVAVSRARDALALLAAGERFQVILCDLMMPEISGIELHAELMRVAPDCIAQIVYMTGGAFTPQAREFLAKLGRPHLEKPFSEAQLRHVIDSVIVH